MVTPATHRVTGVVTLWCAAVCLGLPPNTDAPRRVSQSKSALGGLDPPTLPSPSTCPPAATPEGADELVLAGDRRRDGRSCRNLKGTEGLPEPPGATRSAVPPLLLGPPQSLATASSAAVSADGEGGAGGTAAPPLAPALLITSACPTGRWALALPGQAASLAFMGLAIHSLWGVLLPLLPK